MPQETLRRRNLPHWDVPGATYFITVCLHGSIPSEGRIDIERHRSHLKERIRPAGTTKSQWASDHWKLSFSRTEHWLDHEPAVRHLQDPRLAQIVMDGLLFFADQRYDLLAFVFMPSRFHWVFQPRPLWFEKLPISKRTPREQIAHSINRHTALKCNELLQSQVQFWQHESYDHWIRDGDELERIIHYVEGNPVKAGLVAAPEEWAFSSARFRKEHGLELGSALVRDRS